MSKQGIVAAISGFLFALGLVVAGMTVPGNVIGFLDVFGDWKPALAFVMAGAIGVNVIVNAVMRRRGKPLFAERFSLPTKRDFDGRLIGGAAVFGIGWGLGGYCPGPGIIAPWGGAGAGFVFLAAMLGGMWLFELQAARSATSTDKPAPSRPSPKVTEA